FSSRRRHTSSKRDWSSDVCSSDLESRSRTWPPAGKLTVIVCDPPSGATFGNATPPPVATRGTPDTEPSLLNVSGPHLPDPSPRRSEERRVGEEGRCRWGRVKRRTK